jgi:hypothetical protein
MEVDGSFVAFDGGNRHVHRFSSDGTLLSSVPILSEGSVGKSLPAPPGDAFLVEGFRSSDERWFRVLERVEVSSGRSSELFRLPEPSSDAAPGNIQRGRVVWTVVGRSVAGMWTTRPSIVVYDERGAVVREIRRPLRPRSLTERDIRLQIEAVGGLAASLRPGPTPLTNELFPVADSVFGMLVTSIQGAARDGEVPVGHHWWRLFTVRGEYLGLLPLPGDYDAFRVLGSGGGLLWALVVDDAGVPVIQGLSFRRADGLELPVS